MARHGRLAAKRANRPNPREERNLNRSEDLGFESNRQNRRGRSRFQSGSNTQEELPSPKKAKLIPRNVAQEDYVDALEDESKHIVFAMGPAGTGKTLLATLFAIKGLQEGKFAKVIITRPAVSVDEQWGFLPGSLISKAAPWVAPVLEIFKEIYGIRAVERMLADEVIEILPLAFMRGRSLKAAIVIGDEMQNATPNQMKMLLTRIGEGSRMVITGDLKQHDRGYEENGLRDFINRLASTSSNSIAVCRFGTSDVERHPVVEEVLRIYGED